MKETKNIKLDFEIDIDTISDYVEERVSNSIEANIQKRIEEKVLKQYSNSLSKIELIIDNKIEDVVKAFLEDVFNNHEIERVKKTTAWGNENVVEKIKIKNLVYEKLQDIVENGTFIADKKDGYHTKKESVSIIDYFRDNLVDQRIEYTVKNEINKHVKTIQKEVHKTIADTFDNATKELLSKEILNVLNSSETYRNIVKKLGK